MEPKEWFLQAPSADKVHGPFTLSELRQGIGQGKVPQNYLVFRQGWDGWKVLSTVIAEGYLNQATDAPPQPPPFVQASTIEEPPFSAFNDEAPVVSSKSRSARRLVETDSFSLWYLLDWKFERYLTPWIVRLYWILALVAALLLVVTYGITTVSDLLPESPRTKSSVEIGLRNPFNRTAESADPAQQTVQHVAYRIMLFGLFLIAVLGSLLSIRVACESVIVLFNIANSAKSCEKLLTSRGEK